MNAHVDVLERILNCGSHMQDVHDAVAELIEAASNAESLLPLNSEEFTALNNALNRVRGRA